MKLVSHNRGIVVWTRQNQIEVCQRGEDNEEFDSVKMTIDMMLVENGLALHFT